MTDRNIIAKLALALALTGCTGMSTEPAPIPPDAPPASLEWLCTTSWTDAAGMHTHTDAFITSNTAQGTASFEAWKQSTVSACEASCSCACTISCQSVQ